MKPIEIRVYGKPAPQGSKNHKGKGRMVEDSPYVPTWREAVKNAAKAVMDATPGFITLDGPLIAEMVFTFARAKSHYRTGRNAHLLRDAAPLRPASPPDVSKLVRSTEDALTDIGVWADDARVVEYTRVAKVYALESQDALARPGAVIRVWLALGVSR